MFKHDDFTVQYHLKRGAVIRQILTDIKILVTKEQAPIEWRRVTFAYAPKANKFGGIANILWELESEGSIVIDVIPTARGMMKTISIPELLERVKA